jgi:hypothetical protein
LTSYTGTLLKTPSHIATKNGFPVGISYQMDGVSFASSNINKKFNWNGLQQQGITFDTDKEAMKAISKNLAQRQVPGSNSKN